MAAGAKKKRRKKNDQIKNISQVTVKMHGSCNVFFFFLDGSAQVDTHTSYARSI